MRSSGNTFKVNLDSLSRLGRRLGQAQSFYDKELESRVQKGTELVWRIAHQKRPMITNAQAKAEGRAKIRGTKNKYRRVSDPNAKLGVPVQTGRLQASIVRFIERLKSMSFRGTIETRGVPYAGYVEFGTSRMRARPYMRPAVALTKESLKSLFGAKVIRKF